LSPSDERTYCVSFESESLSGIEALRSTGLPLITKSSGSYGELVCKIGDVGTDASDCPASDQSYWAYWHLQDGRWAYSGLGASSFRLRCGGVDGWTWYPKGKGAPPSSTTFSACPAGSCPTPVAGAPKTQAAPPPAGQAANSGENAAGDTARATSGQTPSDPSSPPGSGEGSGGTPRTGSQQGPATGLGNNGGGSERLLTAPQAPGSLPSSAGPGPLEPTIESISLGPPSATRSRQRRLATSAPNANKSSAAGGYLLFGGLMAALLALRIYIGTTRRR